MRFLPCLVLFYHHCSYNGSGRGVGLSLRIHGLVSHLMYVLQASVGTRLYQHIYTFLVAVADGKVKRSAAFL